MTELWYYEIEGRRAGPVPTSEIESLIERGVLKPSSLVWTKGMSAWAPLETTQFQVKLNDLPPDLPPQLQPNTSKSVRQPPPIDPPPSHPSASQPSVETRKLGGLSRWLQILMIPLVITSLLYIAATLLQLAFFASLQGGLFATQEKSISAANVVDNVLGISAILFILAFASFAFVYLRLIYRASKNLHISRPGELSISPGWAVGWNFVPIALFWKPYEAVREIWEKSQSMRSSVPARPALGWWWATWLIGNVIGYVSLQVQLRSGGLSGENIDIGMHMTSLVLDLISTSLFVASVLLLMPIVRQIVHAQDGSP